MNWFVVPATEEPSTNQAYEILPVTFVVLAVQVYTRLPLAFTLVALFAAARVIEIEGLLIVMRTVCHAPFSIVPVITLSTPAITSNARTAPPTSCVPSLEVSVNR